MAAIVICAFSFTFCLQITFFFFTNWLANPFVILTCSFMLYWHPNDQAQADHTSVGWLYYQVMLCPSKPLVHLFFTWYNAHISFSACKFIFDKPMLWWQYISSVLLGISTTYDTKLRWCHCPCVVTSLNIVETKYISPSRAQRLQTPKCISTVILVTIL